MKNRFWISPFVLIGLMLLFTYSCKKDTVPEPDPVETPSTPTISTEKSNVFQMEVIPLISKNLTLNANTYAGTIGGVSINITVLNDTLLGFMMPTITFGTHTLTTSIEGNSFTLTFNILQSTQINDPVLYVNDFVSQFQIPAADTNYFEIQDNLNYAMQQFNSLTPTQQQEAAAFIAANRMVFDEVNIILNEQLSKSGKTDCSLITDNTAHQKCVVEEFCFVIAKLSAPVVVGALLGSAFTPVGSFIGGCVGILFVKVKMKYSLQRSHELWEQLTDNTFAAVNAEFNSSKTYSFNNNAAKSIIFEVSIRNTENKSYTQSWINNFIIYYNKFNTVWNILMGNANTPVFAPLKQETVYADNFAFVSIQVLNNSNITGTLSGTVNNMKATFTTTQTTDQNFKFKMTYNDGEFEVSTSEIDATLTNGCSTYIVGGYEAVQIGSQVWMANNLNIATANSNCYDNNPANCTTYGRLYTWDAAMSACPSGWHLPSDVEWTALTSYLGSISVGAKLKEADTTHWCSPNLAATNVTSFTALPGGGCYVASNYFYLIGEYGEWWSSTGGGTNAYFRDMSCLHNDIYRDYQDKGYGLSVRCLKN